MSCSNALCLITTVCCSQLLTQGFFSPPYLSANIHPQPGFARTSFHVTLHHLFLFAYTLALDPLICYWDTFTQHREISAKIMLSTIISKGFNSLITVLLLLLKMYCLDKCLKDTKSVTLFFFPKKITSETLISKQYKSSLKPVKVFILLAIHP